MSKIEMQCHICFKKLKVYWIMRGPDDCIKSHCGASDCFHKCWNIKLKEKVDAVPMETKQKILDLLHEGKTIGEVQRIIGLETLVMGEIITNNIEQAGFKYLRKEPK